MRCAMQSCTGIYIYIYVYNCIHTYIYIYTVNSIVATNHDLADNHLVRTVEAHVPPSDSH